MRTLIFIIPALLSGCISIEQMRLNDQRQAEEQSRQQEAYRQAVFSQCDRMGFSRGTDAHANCVMQTHNQNQANRAAIGAALVGGAMANQPRQTQCSTDYYGRVNCISR